MNDEMVSSYVWTMDDATVFVRALWEVVQKRGYHAALTGSVLTKGCSSNDLDIILYPHSTKEQNYEGLVAALKDFGMVQKLGVAGVHKAWVKLGSNDEKHVEIWTWQGKKVDLLFLK